MNTHTPERLPDETQDEYRARRAASRAAFERTQRAPQQSPFRAKLGVEETHAAPAGWFQGQHRNPLRNLQRHARRARG